jgi:hypothetical protein
MTKKMIFVFRVGFFFFFSSYFSMDDLAFNGVALILDTDIDANVSIETHMKYDKLLILKKKVTKGLFKIYKKPKDHIFRIRNSRTKLK